MKLAIYAHYSPVPMVAGCVLYCLRQLRELGFQICFVSNSPLADQSIAALKPLCDRVLTRENTGLDFCMWKCGMAEYDLLEFEELLLMNSSVVGPLQPLGPFWQRPDLADCDFWGLTDNDEFKPHLSGYFLVFRQRVLHSARFRDFWQSVLPYQNKWQVIFSYELGLTGWLEEGGFSWRAAFPQKQILAAYRSRRGFAGKLYDRWVALNYLRISRALPSRLTMLVYPDVLCEHGMPFLKASLLRQNSMRFTPPAAFALLEKSALPREILHELRQANSTP
jgi:hypothetical protein